MTYTGSYMGEDDIFPYWNSKSYDSRLLPNKISTKYRVDCDQFPYVEIAAEKATGRIRAVNHRISDFMETKLEVEKLLPYSFFPPILDLGIKKSCRVNAQMSGGRTFIIDEQAASTLGISPYYYLDLEKLGWGKGILEMRLEIKGAGSFFSKSKLNESRFLDDFLKKNLDFMTNYNSLKTDRHELIIISPADFLRRHIGGQLLKFAIHSVLTSNNLLGKIPIKFLPSILAIEQSNHVIQAVNRLKPLIVPNVSACIGSLGIEVRLTASSVRAIYFENAKNKEELIFLVKKISKDYFELEETLLNMIEDVKKYFELICNSTQAVIDGAYAWIKVGDINEEFERSDWYRKQDYAHVLAKDEVIVNKVGKFFTDMESLFGKDIGYTSKSFSDLIFHHELFIINVLRDHIRVCTKFLMAMELMKGSKASLKENDILEKIIALINKTVNLSPLVELNFSSKLVRVVLNYKNLNQLQVYKIEKDELF